MTKQTIKDIVDYICENNRVVSVSWKSDSFDTRKLFVDCESGLTTTWNIPTNVEIPHIDVDNRKASNKSIDAAFGVDAHREFNYWGHATVMVVRED